MQTLGAHRFWVCVAAMTMLFACGGATESSGRESSGEAGATSLGTGGASVISGGRTGDGGSSGLGSAPPSQGGCCGGMTPYCHDGYVEVASLNACPIGSSCYTEAAWCCGGPRYCASTAPSTGGASTGGSTGSGATGNVAAAPSTGGASTGGSTGSGATGNVAAAPSTGGLSTGGSTTNGTGGACNLLPICGDGYTETTMPCDASSPYSCYATNACRVYVTCLSTTLKCDRAADYNRHYFSANTEICKIYDFVCEQYPTIRRFDSACGCGCEQLATCPATVNCMPGAGTADPLCTDAKLCPFTVRAL